MWKTTLRHCECWDEASQARAAVASANRSLELANDRYVGGVTTYLEVIAAQTAALANQITAAEVLTRRMTASVLLIKALGGGWTTAICRTLVERASRKGVRT
jgi:outer membrane protein TolC